MDPRPDDDDIEQVSVDLRLARGFSTFKKRPHIASVHVEDALLRDRELWEHHDVARFVLQPRGFVLATTFEQHRASEQPDGVDRGRSTWARAGIGIHPTAPKIDPGFVGHIALEIVNMSEVAVELRPEVDAPAQLVFAPISTGLTRGDACGSDERRHKFQFQSRPLGQSD